jgi:hypothetical protein
MKWAPMSNEADPRRGGDAPNGTFAVRCQACGKLSQFAGSDAGLVALCVACGARLTVAGDPGDTAVLEAITDAGPADAARKVARKPAASADPQAAAAAEALAAAAVGAPVTPLAPTPPTVRVVPVGAQAEVVPSDTRGAEAPPNVATVPLAPPANRPLSRRRGAPSAGIGSDLPHMYFAALAAVVCAALLIVIVGRAWIPKVASTAGGDEQPRDAVRRLRDEARASSAAERFQEAYDAYRKIDELAADRSTRDAQLRAELEQARGERDALFRQ